jgi:ABC-type multidrug transport system fused ATPase/permease subunit
VERGLDSLADLEDAVAGRAKSLFKQDTVTFKAIMPPPPETTQTKKEDGRRPIEFQKEESHKEESHEEEFHEESSDDEQEIGASVDLYKLYGENKPPAVPEKKLIGANGGASTPMQPVRPLEKSTAPNGASGEGSHSRLVAGDAVERQQREKGSGPEDGRDTSGPYSGLAARDDSPRRAENPYVGNGQKMPQERPVAPKRSNPISKFNNARASSTSQSPPSTRPARPFVDDDEPSSLFTKFVSILPPLPHLPTFSRLIGRGSGSYKVYTDSTLDAWKKDDEESSGRKQPVWTRMFRRKSSAIPSHVITTGSREASKHSSSTTPPITELLARSKHGNATCLLSDQDFRKSRALGKSRAVMDVVCLGFLLLGVRESLPSAVKVTVPHSVSDLFEIALPELRQALGSSLETWAPFGFVAAFLALQTNSLLYGSSIRSVASSVGSMVQSATEYSQLYLRLIASLPVDKHIPDRMYRAASSQFVGVAAAARLRSFVLMVLSVVVVMTVSMVRPVVVAILVALTEMVTLEQWRHYPLPWSEIGSSMKNIILPLGDKVRDLIAGELGKVIDEPLKLVFICSVFLAVLAMTTLPVVEQRRAVPLVVPSDEEDEDEAAAFAFGSTESISKLGSSSASRLGLLAESGAPEAIVERWRAMLPETKPEHRRPSMQSTLRLVGYGALTAMIASLPLVLHHILGMSSDLTTPGPIHVHSVVDSSVLLAFAVFLTWNAMGHLIVASDALPSAVSFLKSLSGTVEEFAQSQQSSQMSLQWHATVSPTKGLAVTDLWAAHTAKRAWAVRGAHLSCRNGEVVVILGDDGAGKSRLLTAISEAIVAPPRRSLSTTRVRGSITFGGVDVAKWDRGQIKKRLGLVLNDVRSVSATADLFSGLTLEEILEPLDGVHQPGEPHILTTQEKTAMGTALQVRPHDITCGSPQCN